MKTRTMFSVIAALLAFVCISTIASEISWSMKERNPGALRQIVGLPGVAVGNLNPSARNPGIELLCTGLYDVPGGFCYYYAPGVPFTDFPMPSNFSTIKNATEDGK